MSSPERFNPEDQDRLWVLRKQVDAKVGKPSPSQIRQLVTMYRRRTELHPLSFSSDLVVRLKENIRALTELYPNNPYLAASVCADQIDRGAQRIMHSVKDALTPHNNPETNLGFTIFFDIATGMELVAESVLVSQKILTDPSKSKSQLLKVIARVTEKFNVDPVTNIKMQLATERRYYRLAELLQGDISGFSPIEDVIRFLKDSEYSKRKGINIPVPYFLVREFVIAGAELGAERYKKLYPLISLTTPPKSF